jgi:CubicO group peptidase (beta-lactamase class C family)
MKIANSFVLLLSFLLISSSVGTNNCSSSSANAEFEKTVSAPLTSATPVITERIQRVENGLLLPIVVKGQPSEPMKLVDRMRSADTPGLSIAVINNGRIEWAKGYGVLDGAGNNPVTTETLFQAGSISKAVTAVAALRLVQQGKLNLDEDVNRKLVSWKVPENDFTKNKKVTLRGLLSHSAGVNVPSFIGYLSGEPVPTLVQVLDGTKPANTPPIRVDSLPGSQFRYSGGGFTIVQQLLIDLEKKPFPDLMRELVFKPLKMKHSTFEQRLPKDFITLAAAGHDAKGEKPPGRWRYLPEMAAAGMWTTPSDLALLAIELQKAQAGQSNKFLTAQTVNQMFTTQLGNWGLGFSVEGEGRAKRFNHGGSTLEFNSYLVAYNNSGQGAVIMVNSLRGERVIDELLRSIAKEYGWDGYQPKEKTIAAVNPKIYEAYLGQYELEISSSYVVTISTKDGKLTMTLKQPTGESGAELLPESETQFFRRDVDFQMTFVKNNEGQTTGLIIRQEGAEYRARKIK